MAAMLPRMLHRPIFHIDTNLINARQKMDEVNRLEKWECDGVIVIVMSAKTAGTDRRIHGHSR